MGNMTVSSLANCRGSVPLWSSVIKGKKLCLRQVVCCRKQFDFKLTFQIGTFGAVSRVSVFAFCM